ncbi:carbohydrate deacetylase [candidate division KSB1 bacterium]
MNPKKLPFCVMLTFAMSLLSPPGPSVGASEGIRLIVRGDDMGMTHAANEAIQKSFEDGILTCSSIQVPSPRFEEALEISRDNPDWCIGIHLTCLAEWRGYRWRPTLPWDRVPSLVDEDGFFFQYPGQLPPEAVDYNEMEAEFRAQIELAKKKGLKFHYLDTHYMGPSSYPKLGPVLTRLSRHYNLPVSGDRGEIRGLSIYSAEPDEKEAVLAGLLKSLSKPGIYLLVCHPGLDNPENSSCVHADPAHTMTEGIGRHRAAVTAALTSARVRRIIESKGIELIDYRDRSLK